MKLITEINESVEYIAEANGDKKDYYIKGVFMQGDLKNRNGRMYPMEVLDKEVKRYTEQYINKNRAYGESIDNSQGIKKSREYMKNKPLPKAPKQFN